MSNNKRLTLDGTDIGSLFTPGVEQNRRSARSKYIGGAVLMCVGAIAGFIVFCTFLVLMLVFDSAAFSLLMVLGLSMIVAAFVTGGVTVGRNIRKFVRCNRILDMRDEILKVSFADFTQLPSCKKYIYEAPSIVSKMISDGMLRGYEISADSMSVCLVKPPAPAVPL